MITEAPPKDALTAQQTTNPVFSRQKNSSNTPPPNAFWKRINGNTEIQSFRENLISQGFSNAQYIEPTLTVIDENTAILASNWTMNKANGIIANETWVMQPDGTAKLRIDDFAVTGE